MRERELARMTHQDFRGAEADKLRRVGHEVKGKEAVVLHVGFNCRRRGNFRRVLASTLQRNCSGVFHKIQCFRNPRETRKQTACDGQAAEQAVLWPQLLADVPAEAQPLT